MRKNILLTATLLFGLTLAGCSAHYRKSLADYRRHEPTPFLKRTLDWTGQPGATTSGDQATSASAELTAAGQPQGRKNDSLAAVRAELGQPEDAFVKVVADVLALTTETVRRELDRMRDEAALRQRLADTLTLRELNLAVALHNPAVKAGRQSWQAALRQFEQADFLESLVGEYRTFTRYLNVEPGNQMNRQMAQTFFPSPSTMALKGEMIRQMARMAYEEWQMSLREQTVEAGQAFYEYQYTARAAAVTRENIDLVRGLLKVVEEGYRSGSATQADLLKMQTTLARQENELGDLESMRAAQAGKINGLLGRGQSEPLGAPEDKDYPRLSLRLEAFIERALRDRQEVQIQQAKAERTRIAIRMGEVMNRPLASRGYSVFERGMMGEAEPQVGGMESQSTGSAGAGGMGEAADGAGMGAASGEAEPSFGLRPKANARPLYAQAESYLAEMRQRLEAERAQVEQVTAQTRSQARAMLEELGVARREVELVQGVVLPQNQSTYDATLAGYTAGSTTFLELLDAERMLLEARMELQKARRDLNKAAVGLAMIAGQLVWP